MNTYPLNLVCLFMFFRSLECTPATQLTQMKVEVACFVISIFPSDVSSPSSFLRCILFIFGSKNHGKVGSETHILSFELAIKFQLP